MQGVHVTSGIQLHPKAEKTDLYQRLCDVLKPDLYPSWSKFCFSIQKLMIKYREMLRAGIWYIPEDEVMLYIDWLLLCSCRQQRYSSREIESCENHMK